MMVTWFLSCVFVMIVLWGVGIYNRLVRLKNDVNSAWSQIDVQLKRRYDLIPNLIAAVRGFMDHERSVLEKVVLARAQAMSAERLRDRASAEDGLTDRLKGLFLIMENYPVLRSSENVMQLQEELVSTENRIAFARQLYNDLVANYMTRREIFPDSLIASFFSFRAFEYFRVSESDRLVPDASVAG